MVSLLHCSLILSFFICIIISLRPAWLARALLSFKRAQSSGNDDADEGQKTPFVCADDYICNFPVSFLNLASIKVGIPRYEQYSVVDEGC